MPKEKNPFEEPHVVIKEQTDRGEEGKIELDEIREENQTEDTDLLNGFEEKKKEFPRVYDEAKKEYHISRDELDEQYSNNEDTNEFIDSIDKEKESGEENLNEIKSTKRNFLPGKIGKKVVKIIHEHVDAEKWNKMSEKERNEFNENKQKKIEDLYIKK